MMEVSFPGVEQTEPGLQFSLKEFRRAHCVWRAYRILPNFLAIMEHLPVELRQEILQRMDLETLKVMRLTTKSWASLGEEYLMPAEFSTLPHRNDIDRVLAISRHPKYSYRIQSLFINLGEINEWHARHNAYFMQYMRNSDERSEALETAWSSYALLKEQTKQNIDTFCELPLLMEAFSRLPNLRSISVRLVNFFLR